MSDFNVYENVLGEEIVVLADSHEEFLGMVESYMMHRLKWYNNLYVNWDETSGQLHIRSIVSPWVIASTLVVGSALLYSSYILVPLALPIIKFKVSSLTSLASSLLKEFLSNTAKYVVNFSIDIISLKLRLTTHRINGIVYKVLNMFMKGRTGISLDGVMDVCSVISGLEVLPLHLVESPVFELFGGFSYVYLSHGGKAYVFKNSRFP